MKLDLEVLLEQRREERNNAFWKYQRVIEASHSRLNLQTPYSIEVEALLGYRKPLKRQLAKRCKNRDFGPKDKCVGAVGTYISTTAGPKQAVAV